MNIDDFRNDILTDKQDLTNDNDKDRNIVIQNLIKNYLELQNLPEINEILAKEGKVEEPGVLTITHIKLLQCMIKDYYLSNNQSIEKIANESGIKLIEGSLSDIENKTLDLLIDDYCKTIKKIAEITE